MEDTKIEWANHTFNPWMGCTKVSPACANCYAERDMDKRLGKVAWGPSGNRVITSEANWQKPIKWNRTAGELPSHIVKPCSQPIEYMPVPRPRVFCASLADVFEDWQGVMHDHQGYQLCLHPSEPDRFVPIIPGVQELTAEEIAKGWRRVTMDDVRGRLFRLIDKTPNLDFLLLTKRPENIRRMWAHVESSKRKNCHRCGKRWRDRNGLSGAVLATAKTDLGQVESMHQKSAVQASASGNEKQAGLPTDSCHVGQEEDLRIGSPTGLAPNERPHSQGHDDQSQERNQDRQPTGEPGASHNERAEDTRHRSVECRSQSTEGIEAPQDQVDREGHPSDPISSNERRNAQGHRVRLRHEGESDWCHCESPDVETRLTARNNVWIGTSAENQEQADKRIPELLKCRDLSPVLFLSCEPLLGPVDLNQSWKVHRGDGWKLNRNQYAAECPTSGIDWVIAGGESGPEARQSNPEWFRLLRDECLVAGIPYHFKQWGEWSPYDRGTVDTAELAEAGSLDVPMVRYGKKLAGRMLDGVTHDEFPKTQ